MRRSSSRALPFVAIALALVGLGASAASLADSLAPAPAWCAESGCAAVRTTAWAKPLGIPLPIVGVAFFASLLALSLLDLPRARRAVAIAGGAGALGLVALQAFVIGAWCALCLVADLAAISVAALMLAARSWPPPPRFPAIAAVALGALVTVVPFTRSPSAPAPPAPSTASGLPEVVAREQRADRVTVVDFIDFECPFCRALHARLTAAIEHAVKRGIDVHLVRKMVPLDMHAGALPAAIAWCCADQQGKGDAMAEALMAAPIAELTAAGCERIAAELGLDLARYRADATSAAIRTRIERDVADARAAGVRSLPTVYIDAHAFVGAAATVDDLVAALVQ